MREHIVGILDTARKELECLQRDCCTAKRLPLLGEVGTCIGDARKGITEGGIFPTNGDIYKRLARAGEVVGHLAVTCCVPERLKQYSICLGLLNAALFDFLKLSHASRMEGKQS